MLQPILHDLVSEMHLLRYIAQLTCEQTETRT